MISRPLLFLLGLLFSHGLAASDFNPSEVDEVVRRAMEEFRVPGMAVGVIKDGEVLYAAGHGIRETGKKGAVDSDTLFRIASASKAFTAAALAVLVDRDAVSWDGPVINYLPEFRMSDPWVTREISLVDLLAHRSGLAPFTGDLMLWPAPNLFTRADIIRGLRHFPLARGFRRGYTYENVLYVAAGEATARVAGRSWGEFVDGEVMKPLGLKRCFAGAIPRRQMRNLAAPHGVVDDELVVIERNRTRAEPITYAPAGGVVCSVSDLLTWVQTHLNGGVAPNGKRLFSEAQGQRMWTPHNPLPVSADDREDHGTHFSSYGLGWRLRDIQGYREVSHTGSLDGLRAKVTMIPELDLGIVVLANGSSSAARNAVMYRIEYSFLPVENRDWVEHYLAAERRAAARKKQAQAATAQVTVTPLPARDPAIYEGRYRDPWFGDVVISLEGEQLQFQAEKSPRLVGPLSHHSGDVFFVQWADRSMGLDAYVRFDTDPDGRVRGISLEQKQSDGQFEPDSFEYLNLQRVN